MTPAAMQVWRGKGRAHEQELRLIEVQADQVVFERIALPEHYAPRLMRHPVRCTVGQLEAAFEFAREATLEDLGVEPVELADDDGGPAW